MPVTSINRGMPGPKPRDFTGERFGRLVGLRFLYSDGHNRRWLFRCDCGIEIECYTHNVTSGQHLSCGCWQREVAGLDHTTHGMSQSPTYNSWRSMLKRCYDPKHSSYKYYGGRGIKVCPEWRASFEAFFAAMGPRPSLKHTLDRYPDGDGDYIDGNCRWATPEQQNRRRRNVMVFSHNGETRSVHEWASDAGISARVVKRRILKGWTPEKALTTPIRGIE